ncbi:MAG: glutamate--tRNA ligase [Candidatus Colwellbacteria bacterium]|nr:glutamate--tRNA ligase [Candidatus Colwellbacteria bacterium]
MTSEKKVRVRIAPSPTGSFHIGNARTALFNWLFAQAHGGEFILRIEDTDKERSQKKFEEDIIYGLKWLGLEWDEFYRQSDRTEIYKDYLGQLLQSGKAYYCFCSKEELEEQRQAMLVQGLAPKYSGKCRTLNPDDALQKVKNEEAYVVRLKIPDVKVSFQDIIRGHIEFDGALMGDIVIAKEGGEPLYNFAVTVDDTLSGITHIIRGEDHISNTPRQIFIMQALGFEPPQFAHLPMILNPDRSKISKRYNSVALTDYIKQGYVKEALVNFLALIGWHPKGDEEVMGVQELIKQFDLKKAQKGGAVFSQEKLDWFNNHYIKAMGDEELLTLAQSFVPKVWKLNTAMVNTVRGRVNRLDELEDLLRFYFEIPDYPVTLLRWKDMNLGVVELNLNKMKDAIGNLDTHSSGDAIEKELLGAIGNGKRGEMLWPLRVALSGQENSPGPFEIIEALGKQESLRRINLALQRLDIPETH